MPIPAPHRTSWFVTLPVVAAAIGFLSLVFFPTARAIRETRIEIRLRQDFIAQTVTLHHTVAQLEQELKETQRHTQAWRSRSPTPGQLAKVFARITDHARKSGATTTRFEPQHEVSLETLQRVPVQIELAGSYAEIGRLLAALELLPETIWIEQIKMEHQREAGGDVKCELKLEVFAVNSAKSG